MKNKSSFSVLIFFIIIAIEFVEDYKKIGLGYGGYREDQEYYGQSGQI